MCSSPCGFEDFYLEDPALEFSPPMPRSRDRPRKKLKAKRGSEEHSCRPRGRPKKSLCVDVASVPPPTCPPSPSGPYFTRAKKV